MRHILISCKYRRLLFLMIIRNTTIALLQSKRVNETIESYDLVIVIFIEVYCFTERPKRIYLGLLFEENKLK
jgi:hypothetical protein